MKKKILKLIIGVIFLGFVLSVVIIGNSKTQKTNSLEYKVAGITNSPLYLPIFVGIEKGYFEELKVSYVNTTGGDIANTMLISDKVDAVLNSLNVVISSVGEKDQIISIGELTHRGGMTLVSKVDFKNIKTIVSAKNGGLPNIILDETTNYKIVANLSPQEGVTYFLNNKVDAIMAFEPFATKLKNLGYKAKSMNDLYNDIPFNCILIKKNNVNDARNKKFLEGIKKSFEYISKTDSNEIADLVSEIMEFEDVEVLASIIDTFKNDNVWNEKLELSKEEYDYYLKLSKLKKQNYNDVYININ